jgi:hypothetical protein
MRKDWKIIFGFVVLGFAVTTFVVAYQVLTNSYPPSDLSMPVFVAFIILCPPSLLTVPFIDAEVGTGGFYFIWFFVGLINAALYAVVGAQILFLLKKSD